MCDENALKFKQYDINTPLFSLTGLKTWARLVDVYDGDTVTLVIPFGGEFYKFKCRLFGIDACEMTSVQNRELAIKARDRVVELSGTETAPTKKEIRQKLNSRVVLVWVVCHNFDKYGRLLVDVYSSDTSTASFSKCLLDEKLSYEYAGKTKKTEDEQIKLLEK